MPKYLLTVERDHLAGTMQRVSELPRMPRIGERVTFAGGATGCVAKVKRWRKSMGIPAQVTFRRPWLARVIRCLPVPRRLKVWLFDQYCVTVAKPA